MKYIWLFFIIIIPFLVKAQAKKQHAFFSQYTVSAEFGGLSYYLINYENIINPNSAVKFALGAGGSYFPTRNENKYGLWEVKGTVLFGKDPFYCGIGLNYLHETHWYRYLHFWDRYDYGIVSENESFLIPNLHFRYQPKKKGLFAGVSAYYFYHSRYASELNAFTNYKLNLHRKEWFWSPSVNIGYTFSTH